MPPFRQVNARCIFCGGEYDFLCPDHYNTLNNLGVAKDSMMIAVIGDDTPRSNDIPSDSLSVITNYSNVLEFYKKLIEWKQEDIDLASYRFFVLISKDIVDSLVLDDIVAILQINNNICQLVLLFENITSSNQFTEKYFNIDGAELLKYNCSVTSLISMPNWEMISVYLQSIEFVPQSKCLLYKILSVQ